MGDTLAWVDPSAPPPGSDAATCDQLSALCSLRTAAEARELVLIAHLCDTAPAPTGPPVPGQARLVPGGADGTPRIPEFLHLEVGPLLGLTPYSARRLVSDTLDLRHRHPRTWQAVLAGRVRVGLARRAAALCAAAGLRRDQARAVDDAVAERLPALSFGRGVALVEAEIIRADPQAQRRREEAARRQRFVRLGRQDTSGTRMLFARLPAADAIHVRAMVERLSGILADLGDTRSQGERDARALGVMATPARAVALLAGAAAAAAPGPAGEGDPDAGMRAPWSAPEALREVADLLPTTDLDRLAPPTPLYVHANAAHLGPDDLARVEGGGAILLDRLRELLADSKVRLTQVIDCRDTTAVDAYEVPPAMREQLNLTEPVEVFPWSVRRSRGLDADHCRPYVRGRPGQTRITNLGPLTRPVHRAKTHAGFRLTTLGGVRLWRTPIGRRYTVSRDGTRRWSQYTSDLEALVGHRLSRRPSADP
ncbi:hypothetical protein GA0111570_11093 [Raineyella antarctica]|uniref:DUF222 domain-containing protein n=1 Tax=Raineyella antarctica TaxID=1577474 RepID=A0A1G6HIL1_9ACTN|nr:hypothetical protein GA0111570_11093 [Raineyella antarctica]